MISSKGKPSKSNNNSSLMQNSGSGQYADMINGLKNNAKAAKNQKLGKKNNKNSLYKKGQSDLGVTKLLISHQEGVNVMPN